MIEFTSQNEELQSYHELLGLPPEFMDSCLLPRCHQPAELVETEPDYYGRVQRLTPAAFAAWSAMRAAAEEDGIGIHLISAFRDFKYQFELIRRKLDSGQSLRDILTVNAAPGFSEHHTGRAVDIGTLKCPALELEFAETEAFHWLSRHAAGHGFHMSYPQGNPLGIGYEPWHWCFREESESLQSESL